MGTGATEAGAVLAASCPACERSRVGRCKKHAAEARWADAETRERLVEGMRRAGPTRATQVARADDEFTLHEAMRETGYGYKVLREAIRRGDLRHEQRPRGGNRAPAAIFRRAELLEDLRQLVCRAPGCSAEAPGNSRLCARHTAYEAKKLPAGKLTLIEAHARFGVPLEGLQYDVDHGRIPCDQHGRQGIGYVLDEEEVELTLAKLPRCRTPGCDRPAFGQSGGCGLRGHGHYRRQEHACEDCGAVRLLTPWQTASGCYSRCASCAVRRLFRQPRFRARWVERRWGHTREWGRQAKTLATEHGTRIGRPSGVSPEQRTQILERRARGGPGNSIRAIARDLALSKSQVARYIAR